jgi:heat shock protein HtpX
MENVGAWLYELGRGLLSAAWSPVAVALYVVGYIVVLLLSAEALRVARYKSLRWVALRLAMLFTAALAMVLTAATLHFILTVLSMLEEWGFYFTIYGLTLYVVAMNVAGYVVSPFLINRSYYARPDVELQRVVDKVAERLGYRGVKAVVVDGPPNAFAYGNLLAGRYVAVTESLKKMLSEEELEAVVGHELGHHINRDLVVMLLLGMLPMLLYYVGRGLVEASLRRSSRRGNPLAAIGLGLLAMATSLVVQTLVLAFSRLREYYADATGARAAGKAAMKSALEKIRKHYFTHFADAERVRQSKIKALFIYAFVGIYAAPLWDELLLTHPPLEKRLTFIDLL